MQNYIKAGIPNVLGVLQGRIEFSSGLNIISGENGTLKTRLLQAIKSGSHELYTPTTNIRIQAISPKRNSERRAAEVIIQHFRQNNRTWDANVSERLGSQINDASYDNYASLGELFYLLFDHRSKDGGDRKTHMANLAKEMNTVINKVFPHYELLAEWDESLGAPRIKMRKGNSVEFPIESLSLGELEVLSLIMSINQGRDHIDVYLIDEPEVHLNWHLEERLFTFLADFCETYSKQAIVVTHSRVIFKQRFLKNVQFLFWDDRGHIQWRNELSIEQRTRLAGDAIEIVALSDFSKPTFFVEDSAHTEVLSQLAKTIGFSVTISECCTSANVKSLFSYQKSQGRWPQAYFVIDGDNMGNPFPSDSQFIHLPYYCIENSLLHPEILSAITGKSVLEIQESIVNAIKTNRSKVFAKNKFFDFLAESISPADMTFERLRIFDGSLILDTIIESLGSTRSKLIADYINYLNGNKRLAELFPNELLLGFKEPCSLSTQAKTKGKAKHKKRALE